MADIVLIHGAWHGGWCWQRVTPLLQAEGHQVHALTLPGMGYRAYEDFSKIGLSTHVTDVVSYITTEELQNIVLVGHSYGGTVISSVTEQIPDRIGHVVFLDSFVLSDGDRLNDNTNDTSRAILGEAMKRGPRNAGDHPIPHADAFGVDDPDDLAWVHRHMGPFPDACGTEVLSLPQNHAMKKPRTYVYCSYKPLGVLEPFRDMAKADPDFDLYELDTGHDLMVTAPEDTARIILAAVNKR